MIARMTTNYQILPDTVPTVFIVDDDEAVRFAISMLVEACGLRAEAFGSVAEFCDAQEKRQERGCLILDLNMPEETGADLLERPELWLPVIVVTGYPESALANRARKQGVVAILEKPFDDEQLLRHVREALDLRRET